LFRPTKDPIPLEKKQLSRSPLRIMVHGKTSPLQKEKSMRRPLLSALLALLLLAPAARAEEAPKPDDRVAFDLASEDWVTTKTARVIVNVEAAVSGATAGSMRTDMIKSVNSLAAAEWRLTGFNRGQDQTGLERWSAGFEARLPESTLSGLGDNAKKLSKAGLQLSVSEIDFSPTLDEIEAVRSNLRAQLYKKAADQLTALNTALPGRGYRIAAIDFGGNEGIVPMARMARAPMAMMTGAAESDSSASVERSEKIKITAHVVLAASPAVVDGKH
jgi:hypothetical protein